MGIQLDWRIEAEERHQQAQEDPELKRARRRNRRRFLLLALLVALLLCAALGFIYWQVQQIDQRIEDDLRAAVRAEFTAIRIGNRGDFLALQHGDEPQFAWLESQRNVYAEYQQYKQQGRLSSNFEIVEVTVEDRRGRVRIRETIDNLPYEQVWFYWNFGPSSNVTPAPGAAGREPELGWLHVPPDVLFWGEEATIENAQSSLSYRELDAEIASALAPMLENWWGAGCTLLNCAEAPDRLEVFLDSQAGIPIAWEPPEGWRLRILSPYLSARVPVVDPVPGYLQQRVAQALSERLLLHASGQRMQFSEPEALNFDSDWLKAELRNWLMGRFLNRSTGAAFMESLIEVYGQQTPGVLAREFSPQQPIVWLAPALSPGASNLPELGVENLQRLDWRSFFAWRLGLERQRLNEGDMANYYALYEQGDQNSAAQVNAADPVYRSSQVESINGVTFAYRNDGSLAAVLEVTRADGSTGQLQFVWTGQTFLRTA